MNCRFCKKPVSMTVIDLVNAPPSNSYLTTEQLDEPETYYPLKVQVCENCWLVQIAEYKKSSEIFSAKYAYFSSYSNSWLAHCQAYVETITRRLELSPRSFVVEVASNDGYLLQYFMAGHIPCLGIEPTASTAAAARGKGIETVETFFGSEYAKQLVVARGSADLIIANNVLAHVPDINDFIEGFRIALRPGGTMTFEFPHLLKLIQGNQFDTIYHEHYSYLSLGAVRRILTAHELTVFDVEKLPTHGGSLRVYAGHATGSNPPITQAVDAVEAEEVAAGLSNPSGYTSLQLAAKRIRAEFLEFLFGQHRAGKQVVAYGAAAKGNTLLNWCGLKGTNLISYVADASPHKQGLFLPGTHIPIVNERILHETKPDYIVILPWNLCDEIAAQLVYARAWGGRFVTCIPQLEIS